MSYRDSDWWETLMTWRVSGWRMLVTVLAVAVVGALEVKLPTTLAVVLFAFALGGLFGAVIAWRMDHAKRLALAEYAVNEVQQTRREREREISARVGDRVRSLMLAYPLDVTVMFIVYDSAPNAKDGYTYTHNCRSLSELFRVVQDWINAPVNYVGIGERYRRQVGHVQFDNRTSGMDLG